MRFIVRAVQIFVGVLFIISGLVKANDPLGLSYKMQEFFELWNSDLSRTSSFLKTPLISLFDFLHGQSLALSVFMITLEIVAGVALLLGWLKNFILWLLLLLILFFTLLTGYAFLSGKFTNCGCFGDCLPITPLTSFVKDLVLLAMILFLLFGKRYIVPVLQPVRRNAVLAGSLVFSLVLQWYVLNFLPLADCLPFKKGNDITTQMKPPPGSVPDSFAIRFIYEKGGKQFEFAPENLPADFATYKFIDRKDKLVRKGNAEPAIKSFALTGTTGEDSTQAVLAQPQAILVFAQDFKKAAWLDDFKKMAELARTKGVPLYVATQALNDAEAVFRQKGITGVQVFNCDFTVVRTAARTEPTILFIAKGTVQEKFSKREFDKATRYMTSNSN